MIAAPAEIANRHDLWKFAVGLVRGGEVSEPAVLRARLVEACESIPADDRPDAAELSKMVRKALEAEPESADPVPVKPAGNSPPGKTEMALAKYLAMSKLNTLLRRDYARGAWCEWSGTHWQSLTTAVPLKLQAAVLRAIADGIEGRTIEAKDTSRLESASGTRGISTLLCEWPSMWLVGEGCEIDPPDLIACPRGVLDLKSGEWLAHDSKRPITKCCPVDPGPSCELWAMIEDHLKKCLGSLYPAVHRFLGSSLLGLGADRRLLWLHGRGGNGKSTLINLLLACLGQHADVVPAEVFAVDGGRGAHLHELGAAMSSIRLAAALEVSTRLDWDKVKGLSGGDRQKTKRMYGRSFNYDRPPVLMLVSNEKPTVPDRASAERLIVAELHQPEDQDERLITCMKRPGKERDAIAGACLTWLIAGCAEFQEHGLGPIPMYSHAPQGLEAWWTEMTTSGRVSVGQGWATLAEIRAATPGASLPHDREVAAYLKSVVEFRRFMDGRRYRLTLHDAS